MGAAAEARLLGRRPSPAAYALSVILAVVFSAAYLGGCQSGERERPVGRWQVVQLWQFSELVALFTDLGCRLLSYEPCLGAAAQLHVGTELTKSVSPFRATLPFSAWFSCR